MTVRKSLFLLSLVYGNASQDAQGRLNFKTMRKTIFLFVSIVLLFSGNSLFAQQSCPRGIKDCRGLCGWFVDRDRDGYCDYTLWSAGLLQKRQRCADSLAALAAAEQEKRKQDSLAKIQKANTNVKQDNKTAVTEKVTPNVPAQNTSTNTQTPPAQTPGSPQTPAVISQSPLQAPSAPAKSAYDLIVIGSTSLLIYLLTFFLSRRNLIKKSTHRKIWNVLLLITFLVTGLIGLFLVIQLNYDVKLNWFASLLYYHVEFGIAMAAISIFHVLWHLKYWLNLFTTKK